MANLTRDLFIPFVDGNALKRAAGEKVTAEPGQYDWRRIDKSTIFALAFNPQEETKGFIDTPNDSTFVARYQPELPEEIILDNENPLYEVMYPFCMAMPTGSSAEVPVLLVAPSMEDAKPTEGHLWSNAIVSPTALDTVAGTLTFSLKLNGVRKMGSVAIAEGVPTFTETKVMTAMGIEPIQVKTAAKDVVK